MFSDAAHEKGIRLFAFTQSWVLHFSLIATISVYLHCLLGLCAAALFLGACFADAPAVLTARAVVAAPGVGAFAVCNNAGVITHWNQCVRWKSYLFFTHLCHSPCKPFSYFVHKLRSFSRLFLKNFLVFQRISLSIFIAGFGCPVPS